MRLLILVFGVLCSAPAESEGVRDVLGGENTPSSSERKPESEVAWKKPRFRCTKKIVIGAEKNETACLMTRRNVFASAPRGTIPEPPRRDTGAREQAHKPGRRR